MWRGVHKWLMCWDVVLCDFADNCATRGSEWWVVVVVVGVSGVAVMCALACICAAWHGFVYCLAVPVAALLVCCCCTTQQLRTGAAALLSRVHAGLWLPLLVGWLVGLVVWYIICCSSSVLFSLLSSSAA